MNNEVVDPLSFQTATGRWSGLGPYYAMFPRKFAFDVVQNFSEPGDAILDPFAGRASSVYAAAATGRIGCGIEINPVGWLYGNVKLQPASKARVLERLKSLANFAASIEEEKLDKLPEFFSFCYSPTVLRYLMAARSKLCWKENIVDGTLMAIILVNLHGRREQSLSNQMRQGKSMAPDYSIRWWKNKQLMPPEIDPVDFLIRRIEWRYKKGIPNLAGRGQVLLGDSISWLPKLDLRYCFNLLFTSPPYYRITNYHYDQWLRLWMLGGPEKPIWISEKWQNRFESKTAYRELLQKVFEESAKLLSTNATIYVRTDARRFTYETTLEVLNQTFPQKTVKKVSQSLNKYTQTYLFGDKSKKPGDIDIILTPE